MINIAINDRKLQVEEGKTILEAALEAKIKIPTLCYHKELKPYGSCRLCLVEIISGGKPGLQASCLCKAVEGLVIKTDTERVIRARNVMFELLLARAPESEPVKALAAEYSVTKTRIKYKDKQSSCILCGLCARVCTEVVGRHAITFANRGSRRRVQVPFDKTSPVCIGCGACAYLCPTRSIKIESAG